uniref:Uncharacterized protein n=1 Tax=Ditylenchus dipsaci TaxID=166011 RepID=A0A915DLH6_9BILA
MTNDQSAKVTQEERRARKIRFLLRLSLRNSRPKRWKRLIIYVVFEFQQVPPGTPAPVTPSPVSAPSPNDYDQMLPSNLQCQQMELIRARWEIGSCGKSSATPSKSAQNWDTPSAKSQKKKKKAERIGSCCGRASKIHVQSGGER